MVQNTDRCPVLKKYDLKILRKIAECSSFDLTVIIWGQVESLNVNKKHSCQQCTIRLILIFIVIFTQWNTVYQTHLLICYLYENSGKSLLLYLIAETKCLRNRIPSEVYSILVLRYIIIYTSTLFYIFLFIIIGDHPEILMKLL